MYFIPHLTLTNLTSLQHGSFYFTTPRLNLTYCNDIMFRPSPRLLAPFFWADRITPTSEELDSKRKGCWLIVLVALNINKVARSQAVVVCFEIAARYNTLSHLTLSYLNLTLTQLTSISFQFTSPHFTSSHLTKTLFISHLAFSPPHYLTSPNLT